jgi:4-carboxymuconolactone decarboxylase
MGAMQERVGSLAPQFAQLTDDLLYGDVWNDPALSPRDRSLITVASLVSLYRTEQISAHLRRALDNGVTQDELVHALTHLAFYVGWPAALTAMMRLKEIADAAAPSTAVDAR